MSAQFDEPECQIDKRKESLEDYSFNAGYMSTERFAGILLIMIQKHRVNVEETDGLVIRMSLEKLLEEGRLLLDDGTAQFVRSDATKPLILAVSLDEGDANAALSLFQTCPEHPTHQAQQGLLQFTTFNVAEDPMDTGRMEHLAGTLTATLTRSNAEGRVGMLRAAFDFAPPRRPLSDFK